MYLKLFVSLLSVKACFATIPGQTIEQNVDQLNAQPLTQQIFMPAAPKKPRFVDVIHIINGVPTPCKEEYRFNPQIDERGNYLANKYLYAVHPQLARNVVTGRVLNFEESR